jgi:Na+/H+-dicarboxylate symporter
MVFSTWNLLVAFIVGVGCSYWFRQSSKHSNIKISQAKRGEISLTFNFILALVTMSLALFVASQAGEKLTSIDTKLMYDMAVIFAIAAAVGLGVLFGEIVWIIWDGSHKRKKDDEQDIAISLKDIKSATKQRDNMKEIQASLNEYFNEGKYDEQTKEQTNKAETDNKEHRQNSN